MDREEGGVMPENIDEPKYGEFGLGGFLDPRGIRESATTRIIPPEEVLRELPGPVPAAIDNSAGFPPVRSQQTQASCSAWAIGYYHATYIENQETPMDLTDPNNQVSPAYLYNLANAGYNIGSDMNDVADLIISNGACSMAEMPYNTGDYTSWPDEDWIWVSGMKRKAVSKTWLDITKNNGMDALKAHLAAGNSAVTHIQVWDNFYNISYFNNVYSSVERYGKDWGGHAVAICGYDDDFPTADGPGALRMVNSWGTGWGDAGYWWLSYGAVKDNRLCYGEAMYLQSENNYEPKMVAKARINHAYRGDIVRANGLNVSVTEGGPTLALKTFLSCPQLENYLLPRGYPIHKYPFPAEKMAFDISSFIPSMNPLVNHDFRLSMNNKEGTAGTLVSFEILNAEWWEGGLSWETPLAIAPTAITLADAWVTPGVFQHVPIRVDSDLDMQHQAIGEFWEGDGTISAPYVMLGYTVNGTGHGYCFYVGNTTGYFEVRDCHLHNASGNLALYFWNSGVGLYNVRNGMIANNTVSNNRGGIWQYLSNNNSIIHNIASNNEFGISITSTRTTEISHNTALNNNVGFHVSSASDNTLSNNTASGNTDGIYMVSSVPWTSSNNTLRGNNLISNINFGIHLISSQNNSIIDNNASNSMCGIYLYLSYSRFNHITNNVIQNNTYGLFLEGAHDNTIYHNRLIDNAILQGYDDRTNFWDAGYPSGGNYWSDYTGIDEYSGPLQDQAGADGIGDTPYTNIEGDMGAQDNYPLMAPWTPPPLSLFNINLTAGWNLISVPLAMDDTSVENVLSSISGSWDVAKWYDGMTKAWKTYRLGSTVNTFSQIDRTMGVWLHTTEARTLNISGNVPAITEIMLRAGWNLVGYPAQTKMTIAEALAGTEYDSVEVFSPASPFIMEVDSSYVLSPGEGLWIKVAANTVWTVAG
ncbi:MAG: NosD domain-containing protein [Thermoplasmata archaeon]